MTKKKADGRPGAAEMATRIKGFQEVVESIKAYLLAQTEDIGSIQSGSPKAIIAKLGELQSAQFALLKAEEAFHERYGQATGDDEDAVDYDRIRAEIGRRLDCIRDARGTDVVSEGTE